MNKKILKALLIGGLLLSEIPHFGINPVQACACCADRNTWVRYERKPDQDQVNLINSLNLSKGVLRPPGEVDTPFGGRGFIGKLIKSQTWQFSITKETPKSGIAAKVIFVPNSPNKWAFAQIDTESKSNYSVTLYHEIVITGTLNIISDSEKLFKGVKKIPAKLILQAKSNRCLFNKEAFYQWILQFEVMGEEAKHISGSGKIQ